MIDSVFLALFVFFVQFGIGGGLYETLVMYPRWKKDVTPANLVHKLQETGQMTANRRYWPFISPVATLLSIINIVLAWRNTSDARIVWLSAALLIFLKSITTYVYFAPTMMHTFEHPDKIDAETLKRSVKMWTLFSPMRVPV
jgi:hypothetical protein